MSQDIVAQVRIDRPILDVFKYIADPGNLPKWVPLYSSCENIDGTPLTASGTVPSVGPSDPGSNPFAFDAVLSAIPMGWLPDLWKESLGRFWQKKIRIYVDDVVPGRRIAYRSTDVGWTTICDFEPSGGGTVVSTTHSLWSPQAFALGYFIAPMQPLANDFLRRVLDGLKTRLEGERGPRKPEIFFSYRRAQAKFVGGRIFDALEAEFGEGTVFRDINSLIGGEQFREGITMAIKNSKVVVVHIGDEWEDEIKKRAQVHKPDDLMKELTDAFEARASGNVIGVVPVFTYAKPPTEESPRLSATERWKRITDVLMSVETEGRKLLAEGLTSEMQSIELRDDPEFAADMQRLTRCLWTYVEPTRARLNGPARAAVETGNQ